jgi:WD40 repeat protein
MVALLGHRDLVSCVGFSADGSMLASGSYDGTILVWDTTTHQTRLILDGHSGWVMDLAFDPSGPRLVSSSWTGEIVVWDSLSGRIKLRLQGNKSPISNTTHPIPCVVYSPRGDYVNRRPMFTTHDRVSVYHQREYGGLSKTSW